MKERHVSFHHHCQKERKGKILHPFISEDPIDPPDRFPFHDALSTDLLEVVRNNWSSIRTRVSRGPLQTRVNFRLCSLDTTTLESPLKTMFEQQTNAFKINLCYGFVLKNKNTGCYRYYHSSCNCCGRYLDEPSLITNQDDLRNRHKCDFFY